MSWIVKLQKNRGQYRITIPKELIVKSGLEDAKIIKLEELLGGEIVIREYYEKGKEKSGIQKDRS